MSETEKSGIKRKSFQRITAWLAVLCIALVFSSASAASIPESSGKILTVADADRTFENGLRADVNGIAVVSLYGTWREMGRQYGMLMKDRLDEVFFNVRIEEFDQDRTPCRVFRHFNVLFLRCGASLLVALPVVVIDACVLLYCLDHSESFPLSEIYLGALIGDLG